MAFVRIILSKSLNALAIGRASNRVSKTISYNTPTLNDCIRQMNKRYGSQFNTITTHGDIKNATTKTTAVTTPTIPKHIEEEPGIISPPSSIPPVNSTEEATQILKKRLQRKKRAQNRFDDLTAQGFLNVTAFSSAEEYDLEGLLEFLTRQKLYTAKKFFSTDNLGVEQDVLYVTATYQVDGEARDIFFFREGSIVLWNFNEIETNNILSFLRPYEKDPYLRPLVRGESEVMPYTYIPQSAIDIEGNSISDSYLAHAFFQNGKFFLVTGEDNFLQKYTFSNAMATSIKLGIWEASLDRVIDSIEYLTADLKKGRRIRITRADVLRKTGELFALRHVINLSSDLLDTPDFYWDREELEQLYMQICSYFSITRRTKVMNEKLNHCVELTDLIAHNLNDAHHIRLEWMIILLIMVEVGFEIMHYWDRYSGKEVQHDLPQSQDQHTGSNASLAF